MLDGVFDEQRVKNARADLAATFRWAARNN